jgi:hypothetical protein
MTQTQTPDRIDATYRANHYPDDAPTDAIATALEGRSLIDVAISQDVDNLCRRCEEKNEKRRMADVDVVNPALEDGDRVTFHAIHQDEDDTLHDPHWLITAVSHAQHPRLDFADVITSGTALIRARATMHERQDGRLHVVDVDITHRSKTPAGPDQSVVDQRQQQYIDDDPDLPDDMTVIDRDPEDPPASWPELDREWLDQLIIDHGPLSMPTYAVSAPAAAGNLGDEPWGMDR